MAIEKHGQITASGKLAFLIKIDKYIASLPVRSLSNLNRFVVGRRFGLLICLEKTLFWNAKNMIYFVYHVIS